MPPYLHQRDNLLECRLTLFPYVKVRDRGRISLVQTQPDESLVSVLLQLEDQSRLVRGGGDAVLGVAGIAIRRVLK